MIHVSTGSGTAERRRFPRVIEADVKRYITAMLLGNEAFFQKNTEMMVKGFERAVGAKNIQAIEYMSEACALAFERTVALAKCESEVTGGIQGTGSIAKIMLLVRFLTRKQDHTAQRADVSAALNAASIAGSKLESFIKVAMRIMVHAIREGDKQIVLILSDSWVRALTHLISPGEPSNRMLDLLIAGGVEELDGMVRNNRLSEAHAIMRLGLELVASAIQKRAEDPKMTQLVISLSQIFARAVQKLFQGDSANCEQLNQFLSEMKSATIDGFPERDWTALERYGHAGFEVLVAVAAVADCDAGIVHRIAKTLAEIWQLAIDSGAEQFVDKVIARKMEDELRRSASAMMIHEQVEELSESRIRGLIGAILKVAHASVQHGHPRIAERVSDIIISNLDRSESVGNLIPIELVRRQMLRFVTTWCEFDASPVYYLETVLVLLAAVVRRSAQSYDQTSGIAASISSSLGSVFVNPSPEQDTLTESVRKFLLSSYGSNDACRVVNAVHRLREIIGVAKMLPFERKIGFIERGI